MDLFQIWRESALMQAAGADRFPGDITIAPGGQALANVPNPPIFDKYV
jgi:hypothetical protein